MSTHLSTDVFEFETFKESAEYKRCWRWIMVTGIILAILIIVTSIIGYMQLKSQYDDWWDADNRALRNAHGLALFIEILVASVIAIFFYFTNVDKFQRRKQKAQADFLRKKEGVLAASGTSVTFHELWTSNNERIDFYHNIATDQSQASFRAAQVTAIAGFIMVIGLGIFTVFFTNGTTAIAASVVGVAAAAMSGYVGATFLKAQAEASAQLRVFFSQPVELARLLSAERLVEQRVDKDQQSDVVAILAAAVLGAPALGSSETKTGS